MRADPDYLANWRVHAGAPGQFPPRAQSEADLKAARWGLLAWEDPRLGNRALPFWTDEGMLETRSLHRRNGRSQGIPSKRMDCVI